MDDLTTLGCDGTETRDPQLPSALRNDVNKGFDGSPALNSESSDRLIPLSTNGHSQISPPEEEAQSSEEVQVSKQDRDTSEKRRSSANPSYEELEYILEQIEDWEDRLVILKGYTSKRQSRLMERWAGPGSRYRQESEKEISIPQLNYVSWSRWNEHGSLSIPPSHYAIDIPDSEPTASQLMTSRNRVQFMHKPIGEPNGSNLNSLESYTETKELPERIRINSQRLMAVLDSDLCDDNLRWEPLEQAPFVILRPFKMFVYLDAKIRNRLKEYEHARSKLKIATEAQYLEELEKIPVFDKVSALRQDESLMSLSELTATINDLRCLTKFMNEILVPAQIRLRENPNQVQFSDLWYIFPQGSLVLVKDKNIPQKVWKVVQRTGGRRYLSRPSHIRLEGDFIDKFSPFCLDCYYLDYDGVRYVPCYKQYFIHSFDGTQPISSLPLYPFDVVARERPSYREELLARGRQFMECTKTCHRFYSGRTHFRTPKGDKLSEDASRNSGNALVFSERVESEVIVDFETALQEVPSWRPNNDEIIIHMIDEAEIADGTSGYIDRDRIWDARFTEEYIDAEAQKRDEWEKSATGPSQDDDLLVLPDRVFAFVLRDRKWACLQIGRDMDEKERLIPVKATLEPWNNLELPEGHKEIVQSLIASHFSKDYSNVHWDLVRDRGKGVIILLHGVPGVGKTSTAECAAASNNKPLLPITCGDLGLTPTEVEAKLQESFRFAQAWNCVLLLDEADIFLAQRTASDIQRNALVSVFLRLLEYYEGILFLTTNRVGTFDEAFKSRIHISLYYPPLDWRRTRRIWANHIKTATSGNITIQDEYDTLIAHAESLFQIQTSQKEFGPVWNGRQIRNAFQSAVALASFGHPPDQRVKLSKEHFDKVSDVSRHFNSYLWRVKRSQTDADLARNSMLRDDGFVPVVSAHNSPQYIMNPDSYGQQPLTTFRQNIAQGMTLAPIGGGFMPNMTTPQAQPQPYHTSGMNGMVPAQFSQAYATQPQLQQIRQEQQPQQQQQPPVFSTQTHFQQIHQEQQQQQQPAFPTQTQFQQIRQEQQQQQSGYSSQTQFQQTRQEQPLLAPSSGLYNQAPNQTSQLQAQ